MKHAFRRTTWAVMIAIVLAGCDGGSSGTGVSTGALGNVASVSTALRPAQGRATRMTARLFDWFGGVREAFARTPLEGIRVSIEGTTLSTETDAQGEFVLRGDFAGPIPMIFDLPDGGRASLVIVVPRGGELTLTNVRIDGRTGAATVDRQHVRFGGLVTGTDCTQNFATMVSRDTPGDGNRYTVLLDSATLRDQSGNLLGCGNLFVGQSADVDGEVQSDGEVEARSVEVEDESENGGGGDRSGSGGGDDNRGEGSGSDDGTTSGSSGGFSGPSGGEGGSGGSAGEGGGSSGEDGGSSGEGSGHG